MSRPGVWKTVWKNMLASISRGQKREYIAEDNFGNKYYVIKEGKHAKSRGFETPEKGPIVEPSVEWASWLKGTRRFPPSEKELMLNRIKEQAQSQRNNELEKHMPQVGTNDGNIKKNNDKNFPVYNDMEVTPGYNPNKK
uniref:NADH dehydrogenase [ubiquinone] 1 alpha subcomplex assembly factor 2 n=1 Tax=Parastrongyloides trichosuri TaxID=131310 RepID=A0A0N4ZY79_PARTI